MTDTDWFNMVSKLDELNPPLQHVRVVIGAKDGTYYLEHRKTGKVLGGVYTVFENAKNEARWLEQQAKDVPDES